MSIAAACAISLFAFSQMLEWNINSAGRMTANAEAASALLEQKIQEQEIELNRRTWVGNVRREAEARLKDWRARTKNDRISGGGGDE